MKHPLEKLSQVYLSQKDVSKGTKRTYRIAFNHYINYLLERQIEYAKTSDVIKYRESKKRLGHSNVWIHIQISALKGLYAYLANNQKRLNIDKNYSYNIMINIQNKNDEYQIKKHILTPNQAKSLILASQKRRYIWDYRDHAIIYLMLVCGMKRYEIIKAKRRDYKVVDGVPLIFLDDLKNFKARAFIKLPRKTMTALNAYLVLREDFNPYLFISHKYKSKKGHLSDSFFRYMFARVLKRAGLETEKITPNCLRQTAAIINLMRGGSISQTYSLLRHKKISSTMVYKDHLDRMIDDSEEKLDCFILKEEVLLYQELLDYLENE